jgi:hypothetical protein
LNIIILIMVLAFIGFLTWAAITYIPMPALFQKLLIAVVCIVVIFWLLQTFGLLGNLNSVRVG